MKKCVCILALCVPTLGWATDVGIGATARSESGTLFVPVEINDSVRVEPYGSYSNDSRTVGGFGTSSRSTLLGVGLFGKNALEHNFRAYYGLRAAYLKSRFSGTSTSPGFDASGFYVEPALGAEYLATSQLALGLEEEWFYRKESGSYGGFGSNDTATGTATRLLVRFYFSPLQGLAGPKLPETTVVCPAPPACPALLACPAVPACPAAPAEPTPPEQTPPVSH